MNKLDKQFEQLMKGITLDAPSPDFTQRVMSRVQAEAAVKKHSVLENYQPVISRKTWIILSTAFAALLIYVMVSAGETTPAENQGVWANIPDAMTKLNSGKISVFWKASIGIFTSIPPIAYLILTASFALWTIDAVWNRLRHAPSGIRAD